MKWKNGWGLDSHWMDGWMDGYWLNGWMDGWMIGEQKKGLLMDRWNCIDSWINGYWMDGWWMGIGWRDWWWESKLKDGWMVGYWINGWLNSLNDLPADVGWWVDLLDRWKTNVTFLAFQILHSFLVWNFWILGLKQIPTFTSLNFYNPRAIPPDSKEKTGYNEDDDRRLLLLLDSTSLHLLSLHPLPSATVFLFFFKIALWRNGVSSLILVRLLSTQMRPRKS